MLINPGRTKKTDDRPGRHLDLHALLVRPSMQSGESNRGYRLRLAHANGLASPSWLLRVTGLGNPSAHGGHVRWCPLCLEQEHCVWFRAWSTGTPICLQHQCWLADTCGRCNRSLTWRSARYLSCYCGTPLAEVIAPVLSAELVMLGISTNTCQSSAWWAVLPIERRWKLAHFLGALHTYGLHGKPLKKASVASVDHARGMINSGAEIVLGEESAFHALLRRIRMDPAAGISVQLLKEAFPTLLERMRRQLSALENDVLLTWVRSFLLKNAGRDVTISWKRSGATVSAAECARHLNVRVERLPAILSLHGFVPKTRRTTTGRMMLTVAPQTVMEIQDCISKTLSRRYVSTMYGLSPSRLAFLVEAGLIRGIDQKVDTSSVADLLGRMSFASVTETSTDLLDLIPLDQLLRTLVPLPLTVTFFRAILAGEIRCQRLAPQGNHLRDLLASRFNTQALLGVAQKVTGEYISLPDAAGRLKLKQEVIYHLVKRGVIQAVQKRVGRRFARFIQMRELSRFCEEVEPLVYAASRHGVSRQAALNWAKATGQKIVSGPSIDGGRQYFILKSNQSHTADILTNAPH